MAGVVIHWQTPGFGINNKDKPDGPLPPSMHLCTPNKDVMSDQVPMMKIKNTVSV